MQFKPLFDRPNILLYPYYFADQCLTDEVEKIYGRKASKTIFEYKKGHIYYYVILEEIDAIGQYLLDRVKKDKKFYKLVEKNILRSGKGLLAFCNKIPENLKKVSNKKLVELYADYAKKTRQMRMWGWVPPLIDGAHIYFLTNYLQTEFKEHMISIGKEDKTAQSYSILSSADSMSEVQQEEIARLKLLRSFELKDSKIIDFLKTNTKDDILASMRVKYPDIIKKIRQHAKRFEWLTYGYSGPCMTEGDVIDLMKGVVDKPESIAGQMKDIADHYKNIKKEKAQLRRSLALSVELDYLFNISSFFMSLKDMRKMIYQKSYVLMDRVIQEIADRTGLIMEETKYLTGEEICLALLKNKDFKDIAKERTNYCVAVTTKGKTTVYIKDEARKIIENNVLADKKLDDNITEFKGSTAYAGKVRGIVKIVLVRADIPKVTGGEILVSSSTNPDLISAMNKAAAFVTDMGGITSHAAIVSRELKKPCIVGTRIATKVLKDGDLVEVDADNGIVKILKKN